VAIVSRCDIGRQLACAGCMLVVGLTTGACGGTQSSQGEGVNDGGSVRQVDDLEGLEFRWAGNGQRTLGTIRVREPSILRFVNDTGHSFDLRFDDQDRLPNSFVSTEQSEGSVPVAPGVYRNIYMSAVAIGSWEISIEPR
jgi:hypothetical protein